MRRKYKKRSIGLPGLLLLLLLAFLLICPLLGSFGTGGGNTSGTGSSIVTPTPGPSEPSETPNEPEEDTPVTPGEGEEPSTPTTPDSPAEEEGGVSADGLALATGRVNAAGTCLHTRYRYESSSSGGILACYDNIYCSRCDKLLMGGVYCYHHFSDK